MCFLKAKSWNGSGDAVCCCALNLCDLVHWLMSVKIIMIRLFLAPLADSKFYTRIFAGTLVHKHFQIQQWVLNVPQKMSGSPKTKHIGIYGVPFTSLPPISVVVLPGNFCLQPGMFVSILCFLCGTNACLPLSLVFYVCYLLLKESAVKP